MESVDVHENHASFSPMAIAPNGALFKFSHLPYYFEYMSPLSIV
ncbi:hypothetical protein SAMN05216167_11516 [Spirosoma endophyticum]|uniref:Uncharacterized protein n=1 Tax=Spirosoma endophyticum TaxID=662367 RepID=A0A1I2B7L0_9BACT|nr:hypothetical protein SAMN05216167_11516 [Spirosoma endophyticum]